MPRSVADLEPDEDPCALILQPFAEPPVVRGTNVKLKVGVVRMTDVVGCLFHRTSVTDPQRWFTRAYGTDDTPFAIPGPTIRIRRGETLRITVDNQLGPSQLECEGDLHFCGINNTNLHVHGMHVSPREGGDDVMVIAKAGSVLTVEVDVPNYHSTGTFWYHPHAHHSTAAQAGGGMHGAIIVEDDEGSLPHEVASMSERLMVLSLLDLRLTDMIGIVGAGIGASNPIIENFSSGDLWKNQHGEYVDNNEIALLVNGQLVPRMTLEAGKWYRFRIIYAAVVLNAIIFPLEIEQGDGFRCDMELLAKDGVYLQDAPRRIPRIYLGSGNRADVAIRCFCKTGSQCVGSLTSLPELFLRVSKAEAHASDKTTPTSTGYVAPWLLRARHRQSAQFNGSQRISYGQNTYGPFARGGEPTVQQELMRLTIIPSGNVSVNLRRFRPPTPCYLVDLRGVEIPAENKGIISLPMPEGMTTPRWQTIYWSTPEHPQQYTGESMADMMNHRPVHTVSVGTVQEFNFSGPPVGSDSPNPAFHMGGLLVHSVHIHVIHYQLVELMCQDGSVVGPESSGSCPGDEYFRIGDFMDTLTYGGGQAVVRAQFTKFTGKYVIHCHILTHEDEGMMSYFNVTGEEGTVWTGARLADPTCYYGEGSNPGSNAYTLL
eukprot:TRINITY_DN25365_c0_g1_i1.p1 TRINITY_DN25365_c0_g1~~TRINITY_DN25365_c0_g1_i1.p1  ORF type:complete len:733 (-),score=68.75 TRINITY_DN25365_c0_g1_i1:358-2325(-)